MMRPSLGKLTLLTVNTLKSAPLLFFGLQFLEGLSSIIAKCLEGRFEATPLVGVVLFFPVFCIASTLSNALTFLTVRSLRSGTQPIFSQTFSAVRLRLKTLLLASLALGLVYLLGFAALILPAFYFMAAYLFVPQMILSEQKELPISLALFRSTKLSKKAFKTCLFTAIAGLLIGIITFIISESVGRWAGGVTTLPILRHSIVLCIDTFLSMATGAIIDVWISHLFLELATHE